MIIRRPLGADAPASISVARIAKWTAIVMVAMWLLDNPWRWKHTP